MPRPPEGSWPCHDRGAAGDHSTGLPAAGVHLDVLGTVVVGDTVRARLAVPVPGGAGDSLEQTEQQTEVGLTVLQGMVADIAPVDDAHDRRDDLEAPVVELLSFTGCPDHDDQDASGCASSAHPP